MPNDSVSCGFRGLGCIGLDLANSWYPLGRRNCPYIALGPKLQNTEPRRMVTAIAAIVCLFLLILTLVLIPALMFMCILISSLL